MSVTDGSLTTDYAQQTVRVVGTITATPSGTQAVSGTVTANQGTPAVTANAWPTKITNGTASVDVAPSTPSAIGNALLVSTGSLPASVTLAAVGSIGAGAVADFGSARQNISMVFLGSTTSGALVLDVSHDNSTWFQTSAPVSITTTTQNIVISDNAFRYARGRITTGVTAGNVTATLMAS